MKIILLAAGGTLGTVFRYFISHWADKSCYGHFSFGTLIVNLIGCFVIGLIFGIGEQKGISPEFKLFFITGFLGAFTTFSAYGLETMKHAGDNRLNLALMNIAANNIGGLILVKAGFVLSRFL